MAPVFSIRGVLLYRNVSLQARTPLFKELRQFPSLVHHECKESDFGHGTYSEDRIVAEITPHTSRILLQPSCTLKWDIKLEVC